MLGKKNVMGKIRKSPGLEKGGVVLLESGQGSHPEGLSRVPDESGDRAKR